MGFLRKLWDKLKRPAKRVFKADGKTLLNNLVMVVLQGVGEMLVDRAVRARLRQLNAEKKGLEVSLKERSVEFIKMKGINLILVEILEELGKKPEEIEKIIQERYDKLTESEIGDPEVL